jgi:PKD repeat protein
LWEFGDNTTVTAASPSHTYSNPGTYTVKLTVTGPGGSDSKSATIDVSSATATPVANFSVDHASGTAPLKVKFTDSSTGSITSRLWQFGDGTTDTAVSPRHNYKKPGSYTATLTVNGPGGSNSRSVTITCTRRR